MSASTLAFPTRMMLLSTQVGVFVPWIAIAATVAAFCLLRLASRRLASRYESQIRCELMRRRQGVAPDSGGR